MLMNDVRASCYAVRFESELDEALAIETALDALAIDAAVSYDYRAQTAAFASYQPTLAAAESCGALLERGLQGIARHHPLSSRIEPVPQEDWSESWKRHFRAARVSDRCVVKPSWETFDCRDRDVLLHLDPGMSFGTGHHFTTVSCLRFIDEVVPVPAHSGRFLDAGCGSGILGIAAIKLGYDAVVAFDNDPLAVQIARANFKANGIGHDGEHAASMGRVDCRVLDLAADAIPDGNHTVVANMLADILLEHAETVARSVRAGGWLVLAGTLDTQYADVRARYEGLGCREHESASDGEWRSGCFRVRES